MTKIKMSNQSSDSNVATTPSGSANGSAEFVERRRASLERYLNRTAQHPVLCIDPDFRQFLEAGQYFFISETWLYLKQPVYIILL